MMASVIKPCDCKHEFQDSVYGKGKRVHTVGRTSTYCTVCGKEKK